MERNKSFREDINGLRAWAVVAVILYHFDIPGFRGGFIGVDVFFVISGYLMTRIIYNGLNNNSLSLTSFYLARAKRIIPALLTLCVTLLIAGYLFLPAMEFEQLGKHSFGAATFLSNILFWKESGYFDADSHDKWLLHTWSLSVEWQFYILLPIALLFIWKIRPTKGSLITAYIIGIFISLALSIAITNLKPSAAFYLLPTRAWEMLAGGLVLLLSNKITLNTTLLKILERIGFTLITLSIVIFDSQTIWPSWLAMLPVIGTCFVIIASQEQSIFSTTKLHSVLGKWSYSLYLWHWPLVVLLNYTDNQNNAIWVTILLMATVILGYASFKYIESPSSNLLSKLNKRNTALATLSTSVLVLSIGLYVERQSGLPGRIPAYIDSVFNEQNNINPLNKHCIGSNKQYPPECKYGGSQLGIIVLGDSHAATLVRATEKALPSTDKHVLDWTMSGCPTILGINRKSNPNCKPFNNYIIKKQETVDASIPILILNRNANPYHGKPEDSSTNPEEEYYFDTNSNLNRNHKKSITDKYIETLCKISKTRTVFIIRPIPELIKNVPKTMGRNLLLGKNASVKISLKDYYSRQRLSWEAQDIAKKKCGINILNPIPYLCDEEFCYGSKNEMPLYSDDDHLSLRGANLLIPLIKKIFEKNNNLNNKT
ncbi:MAG: acyltransferase family protein [Bermanella sp.]